jgi:hypothetical protein
MKRMEADSLNLIRANLWYLRHPRSIIFKQ